MGLVGEAQGLETLCDPTVISAAAALLGQSFGTWHKEMAASELSPTAEQPGTCRPAGQAQGRDASSLGPHPVSLPLSGALEQTQQVTSQKTERKQRRRQDGEKTKIWTGRAFQML